MASFAAQPKDFLRTVVPAREPNTAEKDQKHWDNGVILALPRPGIDSIRLYNAEQIDGLTFLKALPGAVRVLQANKPGDTDRIILQLRATELYDHVLPQLLDDFYVKPEEQWNLMKISALSAWKIIPNANGVKVAVIDTGLDLKHPDFKDCIWTNEKEIPGDNIDNDGDHYKDDVHGINALTGTGDPSPYNSSHGTEVAGVIGANGTNTLGVNGVAQLVSLMPLRFTEDGETDGPPRAAAKCFDYAAAHGASIINYSHYRDHSASEENEAICRTQKMDDGRGAVVVLPAGNDDRSLDQTPIYPAASELDNIIVVAASDKSDRRAANSNYSCGLVDLAAPGDDLYSTACCQLGPYVSDSRGTSIAAPHVAGALALLKVKFPRDDYRALINRILRNVDRCEYLKGLVQTGGRLNVEAALSGADRDEDRRPFNDDLAKRGFLVQPQGKGSNAMLLLRVRSSNRYATLEAGEKLKEIVPDVTGTLWWSWSLPKEVSGSRKVKISTEGTKFSAVLGVFCYSNQDPTMSDLALKEAHDGASDQGVAHVEFSTRPGESYAICVGMHAQASPGYVSLRIAVP